MALNDPLDQIDSTDLDQTNPAIAWTAGETDGFSVRNTHQAALAARDQRLLSLLRAVKNRGGANVSPLYPFKDDATLVPASAIAYDSANAVISAFTIDPTKLTLTNRFIKDLKLIISSEFRDPYLSKITLHQAVEVDSGLVRIFVDLEISARYTRDQADYVILKLTSKAYNDVQDTSAVSSRDDVPFDLVQVPVVGRNFLNSGLIEFNFIGAVQSSLLTSWSAGLYSSATVEGFASVPGLDHIEYTFTRNAGKLAQLAYNNLGDITNAVPFLAKVKFFPFDTGATAAALLAKVITDVEISAPPHTKVFIKRIRKSGSNYIFVFAYNKYDGSGNLLGAVNVGVATVGTADTRVQIHSLGSSEVAGASPSWLDEVPSDTIDSHGAGTLVVTSQAAIGDLFADILASTVSVGSPSPIVVSPAAPPAIIGLSADPDQIDMTEGNSFLDGLAKDIVSIPVVVKERVLSPTQTTRNVVVSVGGVVVNRRIAYGPESTMRDFYGLGSVEGMVDNDKINLDDEWFDTTQVSLKRYQVVSGHRKWRTV